MFNRASGCFRDFTVFSAFLLLVTSLEQSGFGQQGVPDLPQGVTAFSGRAAFEQAIPPVRRGPARQALNVTAAQATASRAPAGQSVDQAIQHLISTTPGQASLANLLAPGRPAVPPNSPASADRDPNYTAAGFRLRPQTPVGRLPAAAAKYTPSRKPIGTTLHPLQLSGPDDRTDPFIVSKANALSNNPQQIFNFVRDHIRYEAYNGSLRGARGTLWSGAGNALDRSSLLVALLGAAGFQAQYVQGTLTRAQAQPLILSMFQGLYRFIGCLPPGTATADPANDATLLGIAENHYWVEYAQTPGGALTDADTAFAGAQPGQTFGTKVSTSPTVPPGTQVYVTFAVDAEMYSQASATLAGNGISTMGVLNQTYTTAQLVGKPVTIGQFVNTSALGAFISANTNTYSPYLTVGEDPTNPASDDTTTGTPIQEVLTNFPLGSTILTGLFAHITVYDASGNQTTYDKTLFDRIGIAGRNGGNVQVSINPGQAPALENSDLTTFNVLPGLQDQSIVSQWGAVNDSLLAQIKAISAQLPANPAATLTPAQTVLQQQALGLSTNLLINTQRIQTANFAYVSDRVAETFSTYLSVHEYVDSPRLIAASSFAVTNPDNSETLHFGFDLLKDDVQVLGVPGNNAVTAPAAFRTDRGILESYIEGQLFQAFKALVPGSAAASFQIPVSTTDILQAAITQGIPMVAITAYNAGSVNNLNISPEAKARISLAAEAGNLVEVPSRSVTINGAPTIGWLEFEPDGTTHGVLENGDHGAFEDYVAVLALQTALRKGQQATLSFFAGFVAGTIAGEVINIVGLLLLQASYQCNTFSKCFKFSPTGYQFGTIVIQNILQELLNIAIEAYPDPFFRYGFKLGLSVATNSFTVAAALDPPLPPVVYAGASPPPAAPGASPGVSVQLTPDPTFTLPVGNSLNFGSNVQIPTVFDAFITNTGPAADTFNLSLLTPPAGFTLVDTFPSISLPAGFQGQVTVCATPTGNLPAPGTNEAFGLAVTSATNPSITSRATQTFVVPSLQGATIAASPTGLALVAGSQAQVTLSIQGTGNVATSVALTAAGNANLTVTGLQSPVSVTPGQIVTQTLTVTASAGTPLNSALTLTITGTFGASNPQQTTTVMIPVSIQAAQALVAAAGAPAASAAGRGDIGGTLNALSGAITTLLAGCTPADLPAFKNYASNLASQLSGASGFFNSIYAGATRNAFAEIQTATCASYAQGLSDLNAVITNLTNLFNSPAAYPFQLGLTPNSVLAQPNSTSTFKIQLQNQSQVTQTYNLTVAGIPPGLGSLNTASITLGAQQSIPAGNASDPAVTISQSGSTVQAFSFTVTATPSQLPGDTQSATATVILRPDVLAVQDVKAQPGFVSPGGSVDVIAHIVNTVNQPTAIQATLKVLNPSNTVVATAGPVASNLSVSDVLTSFDFGQVAIPAGSPTGNYTLAVTISDSQGHPLQGGTGSGFLLVGSPVTASLTVSPQTVPAGASTVLNTLTVTATGGNANALQLLGSAGTASTAQTVALNGNTAYVCDQNEVTVVDVSNPAMPRVITTALSNYITNSSNIHCSIQQGDLVIFSDTSSTTIGNNPGFLVFGLSNPQAPNLINAVPFNKRFVGDPINYLGNTAFLFSQVVFTQFGSMVNQGGDLISVNLSDIANPSILGTLSQNGDPVYGGPSPFYGDAIYNSQILFAGTTTLTGNSFSGGSGVLDTINISDPSHMSVSHQTPASSNGVQVVSSPLIQGNLLVALGGLSSFGPAPGANPANSEFLLVFDISNPQNPVLLSTTPTNTFCCAGGGQAVLGPNQFLYGGSMDAATNGRPVLLLIDTTNPMAPVITPISVPVALNSFTIQGNYLYAPTASGLSVYSVPGNKLSSVITGYTASVQTSNGGTVTYDPASFNVTPTSITHAAGFDTLQWVNPGVSTLTWNSRVTGLQPAQIATVDQSGTVSFTSTLGNGSVSLGPVDINADQIISLTPSSVTLGSGYYGIPPGAQYTAIVRNPTSSAVTYNLTVAGLPASFFPPSNYPTLPASAVVPALSTASFTFDIVPPLYAASGTYTFQVVASASGIYGAVEGTLVFNNQNNSTPPVVGPGTVSTSGNSAVLVTATPATLTAGPGSNAIVQVTLTNVGPFSDSFNVYVSPNGPPNVQVYGGFRSAVTLAPGQSFTGNVLFTIPLNTAVGTYPLIFNAYGQRGGSGSAPVSLNVAANGINITLNPSYITAPMTAQATVTNTGTVSDTFTLTANGPAATVSSLAASSVTLAAGASQTVNIAVANPTFATQGNLSLIVQATSQANTAVSATAAGTVAVPFNSSVTAVFQPASQPAPTSGTAVFPLMVQNTGSFEDGYSASITSTTGGLQATLSSVTGTPTQTIPDFQLPAQAVGQLTLNVTGSGAGTVTVTIVSRGDPTISATATATLTGGTSTVLAPTASATTGITVPVHRLAVLDASASTDTNSPALPLTFVWTLTSAPAGSSLTSAGIAFATAARASFRPDVTGTYVFSVSVWNGHASAAATATYVAADLPPVAVTAASLNAATGSFAFPDGTNSYDPDGQPIRYSWTLLSAPVASVANTAALNNSQTPRPFFKPDVAGAYNLQLIVSDASASSAPVSLIVKAAPNGSLAPNADAGSDQNVGPGQLVTLNGSRSSDPNNPPLALTYGWTFASVPAGSGLLNASILNATTSAPKFTPDVAGTYVLSLVVSNSRGTSLPAISVVHVYTGNVPPNADAGSNQFTTPGSTVTLNSGGSNDPDNAPLNLAFLWWLNSLPASGTATLTHPLTAAPSFVADTSGYYVARVEATDGLGSGFANTLITSAGACDADANGVVNQTDIALIQAALGLTVLAGDPRDFNHDLQITAADVTGCTNVVSPSPMLVVSPLSAAFSVTLGSSAIQQPIQVSSSGNALTFTVASNQPWLTVNIASGSTASISSVLAQVNPAALGLGSYTGTLTFTPGASAVQVVTFTVSVSAPVQPPVTTPYLSAFPASLQFTTGSCGANTTSSTFTLSSTGGIFSYSAVSSATWLSVLPAQGTSASGTPLTVSINSAGLAPGNYNAFLTISAPGLTTLQYPVSLTIGTGNLLTVSPVTLNFAATSGVTAAAQTLAVGSTCGALAFTVQSDQPWLNATPASGSTPAQIAVNATAAGLNAGTVTGHVTIAAAGATNTPLSIPVTFVVSSAPPVFAAVNSASFMPGPLAPGSLFSLFGAGFTTSTSAAQALPLPTQLGGVTVAIGSTPVPLLYVSPGQINAQMPYGVSGTIQLAVSLNGNQITSLPVQIVDVAPGLFLIPDGSGRGAIENQNYSINSPLIPARPGSSIIAFLTGQGAVSPAVASGAGAPLTPLSYINASVSATIGGSPATVTYGGLAPTLAGVAQMNITVPALVPGSYPLVVTIGGQSSNAGFVSVGQ